MKTIERVVEIDAPAASVWAVLADVGSYPDWNPFLSIDRLPDRVGDRLVVTVTAGKRTATIRPTVTVFDPGRSLCWQGRLFIPRLFDGAHEFHVEPIDADRSRFVHRETFRGILVPLMPGLLRDTAAGFAAMNAALRTRCEAGVAPSSG